MNKTLSYFMRKDEERIITVPAPESFVDENGNRLDLKIKVLSQETIRNINDSMRRRSVAFDKKGNPYSANGEVLFRTDYDSGKAFRQIIAEAIVEPDLSAKELQEFYNCYDNAEMLLKVFSRPGEYNYVFDTVMTALGLVGETPEENETQEAKN